MLNESEFRKGGAVCFEAVITQRSTCEAMRIEAVKDEQCECMGLFVNSKMKI